MEGSRELGLPKTNAVSLKQQLLRTTLRNVRAQGHIYIELREEGKKMIFFCTLCLAQCYSDSILFNHLNGNLHKERLASARITLLKPNPWPFNDGVLFFHDGTLENDKRHPAVSSERARLLDAILLDEDNHAIVTYDENLGVDGYGHAGSDCVGGDENCDGYPCYQNLRTNGKSHDLVIPNVLQKDKVSDLAVSFMGVGRIGARLGLKDGTPSQICRIWCEWLGAPSGNNDTDMVPDHDFAIVIFSYNCNLGRKGVLDDIRYLLPASPHSEAEESCCSRSKKRKSFSDPEDMSESLCNPYDSSGEESQSSGNTQSKLLIPGNDDQLLRTRVLSSKTMRKELRKQQRVAAERMCAICQQKMLPSKDVAALLNKNTGKLVCSSRNSNGVFHVFHISCLIHWILLCEFESYGKKPNAPPVKRRSRRKVKVKVEQMGKTGKTKSTTNQMFSAFCPECQGTGIHIAGEDLEKPTVPLSEIFRYKINLSDAHKAWMKSPEVLQNCAIGFHFPPQSEDVDEENVSTLRLLHFYCAGQDYCC